MVCVRDHFPLIFVFLLVNGYFTAPISSPGQMRNDEMHANKVGTVHVDDVITVTFKNVCQKGIGTTVQVRHIRRQCYPLPDSSAPVHMIQIEPKDISLTFYETVNCEGPQLPFLNNSGQHIQPGSFQITKRR